MKLRCCVALLFVAGCAASGPVPRSIPDRTAVTPPPAMTARPRKGMEQLAANPRPLALPVIRIGLLSDQLSVRFERIDGGYLIVSPSSVFSTRRGFTVAAPLQETSTQYAVQVAAISDKPSADALVARLMAEGSGRTDAVLDAGGGVYRIIAGSFPDSKSAEPLRARLIERGYGSPMPIIKRPSDRPFETVHQIVDDEGERYAVSAGSILVLPASADTVAIDHVAYRGGARVFINNRGALNVANELNLEDYLRGVVPNEMGPKTYDELEGLKAQALAARTYAVSNLRQFNNEGYDICATPACQVYKGFSTEDVLSDQAVKETAGMIITYAGEPINALYTATCGGETSDVGTMFPGRNEPYLRRARCVEMEMTSLAGRRDGGMLSELDTDAELFASMAGLSAAGAWSSREIASAARAAGTLLGLGEIPHVVISSTRRGDVLSYLASLWKLDTFAKAVTLPEDRQFFFPQSEDTEAKARLAAAFLIKYRVVPTQQLDRVDLNAPITRSEFYALMYNWLKEHDAVKEATGKIQAVRGRDLVLKADGKLTTFTIPANVPLFRRMGERSEEYRSLPIMIGDRAAIVRDRSSRVVGVILRASSDGASFDRTANYANWTRSYRADELVTSIAKRNPIRQLVSLRPTVVDASKRIAEMEVTAEEGRTFVLKGLPVRWSLNVPDNLFVFTKSVDPDGVDRYTFFGKGWGHGTGMCQDGAYGMAFRGWTAGQIIKRFYAGVEIVPMKSTNPQ